MSVRTAALFLLLQLTLVQAALGAEAGVMSTPAFGQEDAAAAEAAAVPAAVPSAVPASADASWWRAAASLVGLSGRQPGETADLAPASPQPSGDYLIGPGDALGISVWHDEHLTRSVVVLPDGKVSFPLVGEVVASGKSVAQLKLELETKLSRYVSNAVVTVEVKQSNLAVYVIGRVNAPGRHSMAAPMNVLQALAMAGGLNPFAERDGVKIFREHEGRTSVYSFDYDGVSRGRHLETNIELKRGDVVIVP